VLGRIFKTASALVMALLKRANDQKRPNEQITIFKEQKKSDR